MYVVFVNVEKHITWNKTVSIKPHHKCSDMFRSCLIVSRHSNFIRIDNFQVSLGSVVPRKGIKQNLTIFSLAHTACLCLLPLKPAKESFLLWFYGNFCKLRSAFFWHLKTFLTKTNNTTGFGR